MDHIMIINFVSAMRKCVDIEELVDNFATFYIAGQETTSIKLAHLLTGNDTAKSKCLGEVIKLIIYSPW